MPTKKSSRSRARPPIREESPAVPPVPQYVDPESDYESDLTPEEEDTISSIVSRFGGGAIEIKVHKVLAGGGDQYWYTADSSQIDEEKIRTINGGIGGNFKLKVYVGGELRKVIPLSIADAPGIIVAGSASGDSTMLSAVLARMASLEQSLQQRNPAPQEPMSVVVDALAKLDQIRGREAPKEMPLDTILKCIDIGKSLGGAPVDDSFLGVIKDILKEVAPVLAPVIMSGMTARPGAVPALPPNGAHNPEQEQAQMVEQQLKEGISFLKKKCMMGASPDLYLALILESADEDNFARLIHIALTQEFAVFAKLDPEIEQPAYVKFFRHIYDGIRSEIAARNTVDDDTGGAGGNAGDSKGDVRIIQTRGG